MFSGKYYDIQAMFSGRGSERVTAEGVHFEPYAFAPASVAPTGFVAWTEVLEIDTTTAPPEVWLHGLEILFVSAEHKAQLVDYASQAQVPLASHIDLWDLILEPFVDTEYSPDHQERSLRVLEEHGISRERCAVLRQEVKGPMIAYNFDSGLWEWIHLGLYDLLHALKATLNPAEFHTFYWQAMELARRGRKL